MTLDNLNCVQGEENEFRVPGDHLKHRFLDLTKVEFWFDKMQKLTFKCHCHLNCRFINMKNVAFSVGQEAKNDFKVTFDNWNHRFFDLTL